MLFIWESNKREKEQTTVRTNTANKDGKKKNQDPDICCLQEIYIKYKDTKLKG